MSTLVGASIAIVVRATHLVCVRGSRIPTGRMSNRHPQWEEGLRLPIRPAHVALWFLAKTISATTVCDRSKEAFRSKGTYQTVCPSYVSKSCHELFPIRNCRLLRRSGLDSRGASWSWTAPWQNKERTPRASGFLICLFIVHCPTSKKERMNSIDQELIEAARRKYLSEVERLLSVGADVNAKDRYDGNTPLHRACCAWGYNNDHVQIFQALLEHGAEIEARNNQGCTPLH
jgi:hypothetical protein